MQLSLFETASSLLPVQLERTLTVVSSHFRPRDYMEQVWFRSLDRFESYCGDIRQIYGWTNVTKL